METLSHQIVSYTNQQYGFVRDARKVLLNYCKTIADLDFVKENPSFGRGGSIRNLLVHIANTYEFWVGKWGLQKDLPFTAYSDNHSVDDITTLFAGIDQLMAQFIDLLGKPSFREIEYEINGKKNTVSPLQLFSHVITHEFHHKGQILSLSRHWGYTPIDTDIIR